MPSVGNSIIVSTKNSKYQITNVEGSQYDRVTCLEGRYVGLQNCEVKRNPIELVKSGNPLVLRFTDNPENANYAGQTLVTGNIQDISIANTKRMVDYKSLWNEVSKEVNVPSHPDMNNYNNNRPLPNIDDSQTDEYGNAYEGRY